MRLLFPAKTSYLIKVGISKKNITLSDIKTGTRGCIMTPIDAPLGLSETKFIL